MMNTHLNISVQRISMNTAHVAILLLMFGVTTSVALTSLASLAIVLAWSLGGNYTEKWLSLKSNPLTFPLCALALLVVLGSIYTQANYELLVKHFLTYSRLIMILMILYYLSDKKLQKACWVAFSLGAAITLLSTYLNIWFVLPWSKSKETGWGNDHSVFHDYIAQGVMMTFFAAIIFAKSVTTSRITDKIFFLSLVLLVILSITHLITGRTGYVLLVCVLMSCSFLYMKSTKHMMLFALVMLTLAAVLYSSPAVEQRIALAIQDIRAYSEGNYNNSLGNRLESWKLSYGYFLQHPIFGHGTGSYAGLCELDIKTIELRKVACVHPHNQYLFFLVEYGMFGFLVYAWFLMVLFISAKKFPIQQKIVAVSLLTILTIDGLINSPLWISSLRNFYTALLPLVFSGLLANPKPTTQLSK